MRMGAGEFQLMLKGPRSELVPSPPRRWRATQLGPRGDPLRFSRWARALLVPIECAFRTLPRRTSFLESIPLNY